METINAETKYKQTIPFQIASFFVLRFIHILIAIALQLIYRIRTKGRKNIHGIKKAIIICNHLIYLDPIVAIHAMGYKRIMFATLEETCEIPILGTFIQLLGSFPVPKKDPWNIGEPIKWSLNKNRFVLFYPEGSLTLNSQKLKKFKKGAFYFSIENDVPIIPVTIVIKKNKYLNWKIFKELFKVTAVVSEPIYPSDFAASDINIDEQIGKMITHSSELMQDILDNKGEKQEKLSKPYKTYLNNYLSRTNESMKALFSSMKSHLH